MTGWMRSVALVGAMAALAGCEARTQASSTEVIQAAMAMERTSDRQPYALGQARSFLRGRRYADAIATAQYVLRDVDPESVAAEEISLRAQRGLGVTLPPSRRPLRKLGPRPTELSMSERRG